MSRPRRASEETSPELQLETSVRLFTAKFPWADSDALQTHMALSRAFLRLNHALTRYLLPQGLNLTRAQYNFLSILYLSDDRELSLSDIARETGVSPPYVTKLLDTLEADGLVQRISNPSDRRVMHARLTVEGEERCRDVVPGFLQFMEDVGNNLSAEERAQLRTLLAKYAGSISET